MRHTVTQYLKLLCENCCIESKFLLLISNTVEIYCMYKTAHWALETRRHCNGFFFFNEWLKEQSVRYKTSQSHENSFHMIISPTLPKYTQVLAFPPWQVCGAPASFHVFHIPHVLNNRHRANTDFLLSITLSMYLSLSFVSLHVEDLLGGLFP